MRLKPIREQVVVVMGASSGIGRETALRFGVRGAHVVVSARLGAARPARRPCARRSSSGSACAKRASSCVASTGPTLGLAAG
jgi:NAD(P)-dependent dehydrogenase (short-subunit alcohol dehydrogenase family)